jgi:hypothetical protein
MMCACIALAPLAPAVLLSSGRWAAGFGLPVMVLAALFGYGY